ncbi:MAG: hypothetical protein C0621_00415 [Desulfuromonas sp.]|nr:MAG: hypothetical protein C0621_00415 [Desulfuromonas sp.]
MRKYAKWLVALVATTLLASPAFALTGDVSGFLNVRGIASNNIDDFDSDAGGSNALVDQRFRMQTSMAASEDVKAVFQIETDNVWGHGGSGGKEIGTMGSDAKGQIEVKHLYLDFKAAGANVKAGTQYFKLGRGFIIADDAAGLSVSMDCPAVPDNKLSLFWVKTQENTTTDEADDGDFYAAKYDLKVGEFAVAPYLGYYLEGKGLGDNTILYVGADVDGKIGDVGVSFTAVMNDWEMGNTDGGSFALMAKGTYQMDATTLSLEVATYGDEDAGGEFVTLQQPQSGATGGYNQVSEIITGGKFDTRAGGTSNNIGGAVAPYVQNYTYLKLGAVQKLDDVSKVSAYLVHAEQAADTTAAKAITYGQELDLYYDYTITKGLTATIGAAYLLADSDLGDDDAWKTGAGLMYKF